MNRNSQLNTQRIERGADEQEEKKEEEEEENWTRHGEWGNIPRTMGCNVGNALQAYSVALAEPLSFTRYSVTRHKNIFLPVLQFTCRPLN